jgi:hypothetical protein
MGIRKMYAWLQGLPTSLGRFAYGVLRGRCGTDRAKSDIVTIELSCQGILLVRWTPGAVVTETEANALKSRAAELSSGRSLPMLVEMASMKSISRREREFSLPRGRLRGWPSSPRAP